MKKLLVGVIGLTWALAAQPEGIDLSELKFREPGLTWLNVELDKPRTSGYGGREPHPNPLIESRMHYADRVFERLELKIRDDRLHEGIVRTKNLRKRYRKFFLSQEEREFRKKVQEYRKLDFQLNERWCATGRLPIIYQSDPRLGRIEEMRAEVERLGLGDMTVSRKREADEEAEFWSLVRRDQQERAKRRLEYDARRPQLPEVELLPFTLTPFPPIPLIKLEE